MAVASSLKIVANLEVPESCCPSNGQQEATAGSKTCDSARGNDVTLTCFPHLSKINFSQGTQ